MELQVYTSTTTFSQLGDFPLTPGFPAKLVEVSVAPAMNAPFTGIQKCLGWTDLTRRMCDAEYWNPASGAAKNEKTTQKIVRLFGEDVSGNIVVVLEATLKQVTATQVIFNVTKASSAFQVSVKCLG